MNTLSEQHNGNTFINNQQQTININTKREHYHDNSEVKFIYLQDSLT